MTSRNGPPGHNTTAPGSFGRLAVPPLLRERTRDRLPFEFRVTSSLKANFMTIHRASFCRLCGGVLLLLTLAASARGASTTDPENVAIPAPLDDKPILFPKGS